MLDTLRVRSRYLSEEEAAAVALQLNRLSKTVVATGELLFEFTSGELAGSFDHRVMVRLEREEWTTAPGPGGHAAVRRPTKGKARELPHKVRCRPYLVIEGSVHKHMVGHNVFGGPRHPDVAAAWFIAECLWQLRLWELDELDFDVLRADWAGVFRQREDPQLFVVRSLSRARFPRRKLEHHQDEAVTVDGTTTRLNVYRKGPEFRKHDAGRLKGQLAEDAFAQLQARADETLRIEVQFKTKGIEALFNGRPKVWQLEGRIFEEAYWREVERLVREGAGVMETVREREAVMARLRERYSMRLAVAAFYLWTQLALRDEADVKAEFRQRTFYKYRKMLIDSAVSWHGAELGLPDYGMPVPRGLKLTADSPDLDRSELPEVSRKCAEYLERRDMLLRA